MTATSEPSVHVPPRPFAGADRVTIVLPREGLPLGEHGADELAEFATLLQREPRELEVELGAPVCFTWVDPGSGPRFLIGPASCNPYLARYERGGGGQVGLWLDRDQEALVADGPDLGGVIDAINLLRTLGMRGLESIVAADCGDIEEAIERIETEIGWTYPAFALRGIQWSRISGHHRDQVRAAAEPLAAMQEWVAELRDAHTWVRPQPGYFPLPYALWVAPGKALFARVPAGTAAWDAGVRAGDELLDAGCAGWLKRVGAPAHAHPLITGRRLLAGPLGVERSFRVRKPSGRLHSWSEATAADPPVPPVSWSRLPSGTGYLRVEIWRGDLQLNAAFDTAFGELAGTDRLIVDLRGNPGGNLNLACSFRDRFLRERTRLGSVRYATGTGGLSEPQALIGEPAVAERRWHGAVRFLTDPLTYSASEDALLGLQGLPHVMIVGEPSGGGSGRPRTLRLLPGQSLMVSTALTYDRQGRCIEGAGIPVDLHVVPDRFAADAADAALIEADRTW